MVGPGTFEILLVPKRGRGSDPSLVFLVDLTKYSKAKVIIEVPNKSYNFSKKVTIHLQFVIISPDIILTLKIRLFVRFLLSLDALTHFLLPNPSVYQNWGLRLSQFLQC